MTVTPQAGPAPTAPGGPALAPTRTAPVRTAPARAAADRARTPAPGRAAADRARTAAPAGAVRLAADHLRAAGCRVSLTPDGAVTGQVAGGAAVRAEVNWAGPVGMALAGEADVQAACGLAHIHGRRYGRPTPLGVDYATCLAGVLAAAGALAALAAGPGGPTRVTTSLAQAALLAAGQYLAAASADDDRPAPAAPGGPPFAAADGVRFELETLDAEAWYAFWTALGADAAPVANGWRPFQQRYATAVCPLPPALHEAAARRSFPELGLIARASGVDLTPVATRPPPAGDDGAPPWHLRPAGPVRAPAPGGGTDALPLAGVVVVEMSRRVQGPLAGHLLRMLGAHVVRVEPPGGDPMRGVPPVAGDCSARFTALNHGKDTLEADPRTADGRAAVRELASRADVFLHSLAPGKDLRLGLDADTLIAARPGLVHAAASGWGATRGQQPPIGTDFPVQAWSGLAALVTPPGLPPAPSLLTLTDVLGGAVCAQGALAGLLAARLTGRGQAVTSSLLSAARLLCGPRLRSDGAAPSVPARTDLAALAADPRFAPALDRGPCTLVRTPWEFHR